MPPDQPRHSFRHPQGRLVNHSGRHRLRLPLNWPWANTFTTALGHIRDLPLLI